MQTYTTSMCNYTTQNKIKQSQATAIHLGQTGQASAIQANSNHGKPSKQTKPSQSKPNKANSSQVSHSKPCKQRNAMRADAKVWRNADKDARLPTRRAALHQQSTRSAAPTTNNRRAALQTQDCQRDAQREAPGERLRGVTHSNMLNV
jgi:hypothetical protein